MTLQELQQQVLGLNASDRWQLVQWLLSLLKRDSLDSAPTPQATAGHRVESAPVTPNFAQALHQFRIQVTNEGSDIEEIDFFADTRDQTPAPEAAKW